MKEDWVLSWTGLGEQEAVDLDEILTDGSRWRLYKPPGNAIKFREQRLKNREPEHDTK